MKIYINKSSRSKLPFSQYMQTMSLFSDFKIIVLFYILFLKHILVSRVTVMVFNATFNNISVTLYIVAVIFWFVAEGITKLISTYKLSVSHLQNDILTGEKKIRTFYIIIMIRTDIRSKDNSERQDVLKGVLDYLVHLHHIAPFKRT